MVVVSIAASAYAQRSLVLGGTVYDDRPGLAVRANFTPAPAVTVRLYRDNGDGVPGVADVPVASTRTAADGTYAFRRVREAGYWVTVDSRTISANAWPEQTFGPAGSLCARPDGSSAATYFEGACTGGRTLGSDDATALATAEHLALVSIRESASNIDFAFSANVVVTTADGARVQGSLRQFVENANAASAPSHMRFVPLERSSAHGEPPMGVAPRWWTIVLGSPLPALRGSLTTLDGTAYNFLSPATVVDPHPGRLGETATIRESHSTVSRVERPELAIVLNGPEGIVCTAACGVRALALHGAPLTVVAQADARIEHVLIGAMPDGAPAASPGEVGLQVERGVTMASDVVVTGQSRAGILVGAGARIEGERLDVSRCGDPQTGGGVVLLSDGSLIRGSTIAANFGAGVILGSPDGALSANGNTIDGSTISGNQSGVIIGGASSRNAITRNDLMWNRLGGVTAAAAGTAVPLQNRVSANRFDENGLRPIVLDLAAAPNELARGSDACARAPGAANSGMPAPRIENVRILSMAGVTTAVVRGRACPGAVVELYQSYATRGVRERSKGDLARIRQDGAERETLNQERDPQLPSIGEFNYVGAATAAADGTFEATVPVPSIRRTPRASPTTDEPQVWAADVLPGRSAANSAFAALAIDAEGNTSEMSVRREAD